MMAFHLQKRPSELGDETLRADLILTVADTQDWRLGVGKLAPLYVGCSKPTFILVTTGDTSGTWYISQTIIHCVVSIISGVFC